MLGLRLRSLLFNVGWYVGSTVIAIVGMPILLLSRRANIAWADRLDRLLPVVGQVTCRITHRVSGLENRPAGPVILACKHQSSWETLAFHRLFPNAATVLKRELLFIPVRRLGDGAARATSRSSAATAPRPCAACCVRPRRRWRKAARS